MTKTSRPAWEPVHYLKLVGADPPEGTYLQQLARLGVGNAIIEACLAFCDESNPALCILLAENACSYDRISHHLLVILPAIWMSENDFDRWSEVSPQSLSRWFRLLDVGDRGIQKVADEVCEKVDD